MRELCEIYYGVILLMKMKLGLLIVEAQGGCLAIKWLMNLTKLMELN